MKKATDNILVALDIGTTKICVLVAQYGTDNSLSIIGIGQAPSYGVARGVIVDIAQAVCAIKLALKEAELMAGYMIRSVYVGVSGAHIQAVNSHGMIPIKHGRIKPHDIEAVLTAAKAIIVPEGQRILHVLPQYYSIDTHHKVMDPLGMFGVRLEAHVHIITGSLASVQNVIQCCEMAGVRVLDVILEPLASGDAVLSEDEKELGVGLLDIGGGTSDFAIYHHKTIRFTKVFAVAGNHITHDIALCLRTTLKDAERIKREYGRAFLSNEDEKSICTVEMVHGLEHKEIALSQLIAIIEPRVTELLWLVKQEINQHHLDHFMPTGIVLTGGGSLLRNIRESAYMICNTAVRIGTPIVENKQLLENPIYATGYGLLTYVLKQKNRTLLPVHSSLLNRILWSMKSWVSDFF